MDNVRMTKFEMLRIAQSGAMLDILAKRIGWHAGPFAEQCLFEDSKKFKSYMQVPATVEPLKRVAPACTPVPPLAALPAFMQLPLPVDSDDCFYLAIASPDSKRDIGNVVAGLVNVFYEAMGFYPAKIELSPEHWLYGDAIGNYTPPGSIAIPFVHGHDERYEICCKSLPMRR